MVARVALILLKAPSDHAYLESNMRHTEVVLGNFKQSRDEFGTHPFAMYFVYTSNGSFVVKGMSEEVKHYVHQRYPRSIYYYSFWKQGQQRGSWGSPLRIYFGYKKIRGRSMYQISVYDDKKLYASINVRRVPRKWLEIYDSASAVPSKL